MFSVRSMFLCTVFYVVFARVASNWIPYNGLWYYISEDGDIMTFEESEQKCKLLQGRLAVLSGWPNDRQKLASFTGSTRRWINGDPPRVIYESGDRCVLENTNVVNRYGYICDWQCHSLRVFPETPNDSGEFMLKGLYILNADKSKLRQLYDNQRQTNLYHIWHGNNDYDWCFVYNKTDFVCRSLAHFTPYNDTSKWEDVETSDQIQIHFSCNDCLEYKVTLSLIYNYESIILSEELFIRQNNAEGRYISSYNYASYLEYDSNANQWCLTMKHYLYDLSNHCFYYFITPTVHHIIQHVSLSLGIEILLSCKSTSPVRQSTVVPLESYTTTNKPSEETTGNMQSIVTNRLESIATFEISSVTNNQNTSTVIDAYDGTTRDPRSGNVQSENRTTIYIAIACVAGGIVIIIIVSLIAVCGRRRVKNKRNRDTEQNIQNNIPKSKANMYSVDTQSANYAEIKDSSIEVENKTGKANYDPLYQQAKDPTTENVYFEAEAVDLNNKHMHINSGFLPGSEKSQDISGIHISDTKTDKKSADDDDDSYTEFFNNDIYEGNVNMDRKSTEDPHPVPVESPSGIDIEMYNNSLYGACGKGIAQNNKSELVKNMDSVDEDIEMYDNDLNGS